jgi:hypothetical protein
MSKVSEYDWWRRTLSGEQLPITADEPMCGFYRTRLQKDGPFVPAAIWWEDVEDGDQQLVCTVEKQVADPHDRWIWLCKNPITEAAYRKAMAGGGWDDVDETVAAQLEPPPVGHNEPPEVDALKDQIATAKAGVSAYAKIGDDQTAAKAQTLRSRLLELARDADKHREELKKPHLEAGKAVDAEWQPIVKEAKAGADEIAKALSVYLTAKAKVEAEEQRKVQDATPRGVNVPTPQPAPQPTQIKGGHGRAAAVKVVNVVTEVTDWDALYQFFKGHSELNSCLMKLAQRAVDKGFSTLDIPGIKIEQQRKVA